MTKCRRCNVTVSDDTKVCPLCNCAVEGTIEKDTRSEYPEVRFKRKKMRIAGNILLIVLMVTILILLPLDLLFTEDSLWCVIPIAVMAYAYLIFRWVFVSDLGYRSKILRVICLSLLLLFIIDMETGAHGWLFDYVLPSAIMLVDIIVLILMLTNIREWQSYMIMEIIVMAASLVPLLLWMAGIITAPLLTWIAVAAAVLMFSGTLIIGDHAARRELKRRFHIR